MPTPCASAPWTSSRLRSKSRASITASSASRRSSASRVKAWIDSRSKLSRRHRRNSKPDWFRSSMSTAPQQLVAQGEVQLSDAPSAVEDALDDLRLTLGRDPDSGLRVAGDIPQCPETPMAVEDAVRTALAATARSAECCRGWATNRRGRLRTRNQLRPQFDASLALTRA